MENIPRHKALMKIQRKKDKRLASGVPHDLIYDALVAHDGNVDVVSQELSIAYVSLSNYVEDNEDLRSLVIKQRERILDKAEAKLVESIDNGNLTSTRFALSTLGKERGYVQRSEKDVRRQNIPTPKTIDISTLSVDQLKQLEGIIRSTQDTETN